MKISSPVLAVTVVGLMFVSVLVITIGLGFQNVNTSPSAAILPTPTPTPKSLPAPTNLKSSCSSSGTKGTISWNSVIGALHYSILVDDLSIGWSPNCQANLPGDICTAVTQASYNFSTVPGHTYRWGVQAYNGIFGAFVMGPDVRCFGGGSPTPTPRPTSTPKPTNTPSVNN